MDRLFQVLILEGLGVGMLLLVGKSFSWWNRFSRSRLPAAERLALLHRPTVERNLDELNRFLFCSLIVFFFVPAIFIYFALDLTSVASLVFLAGLLCLSAYPGFCVLRLRRARVLDLRAELALATDLHSLEVEGCHVFYNFPARSDWCIDHVVVARSGVYAIETITERARLGGRSNPESEVLFDGMHLHFNRYTDSDALGQARRSSSELTWELSQATNQLVEVTAVLAIPGCRIRRNGKSEVDVINPDELRTLILKSGEPQFTADQIQRLVDIIEKKLVTREDRAVCPAVT